MRMDIDYHHALHYVRASVERRQDDGNPRTLFKGHSYNAILIIWKKRIKIGDINSKTAKLEMTKKEGIHIKDKSHIRHGYT
jgi:hypothetical protein